MSASDRDRTYRRAAVFLVFTFAYFISQFFRHANAAIAGQVSSELHLNAAQLGLMTSLFYVVFALVQVPVGIALDKFRAEVVTGVLMFAAAAGSVVFSFATGFGSLAIGRSLIGLGMAGVLMGSLKVFGSWFSEGKYAAAAGMLMGLGALGGVLAAGPLAWFSSAHGWRASFLLAAGVAAVGILAILAFGRSGPAATAQATIGVRRGLRQVFGDRRFWHLAPLNLFMTGALMAIQGLWAGPLLTDVLGLPQVEAGEILTLLSAGVIGGYLGSGWVAGKLGLVPVLRAAGILFVLAQVGIAVVAAWPSLWLVRVSYPLLGLAGGFQTLVLVHTRLLFPPTLAGRALTAVNLFGIGGSAILQWLMGQVINAFGTVKAGVYPPKAYATAFAIVAVGSFLSVAWYWRLATD